MGEQTPLDKVEAEIVAVVAKLEALEASIERQRTAGDVAEVAALRVKEELLHRREQQLRDEKLLLLQRQPGAVELSAFYLRFLQLTRSLLLSRSASRFCAREQRCGANRWFGYGARAWQSEASFG